MLVAKVRSLGTILDLGILAAHVMAVSGRLRAAYQMPIYSRASMQRSDSLASLVSMRPKGHCRHQIPGNGIGAFLSDWPITYMKLFSGPSELCLAFVPCYQLRMHDL